MEEDVLELGLAPLGVFPIGLAGQLLAVQPEGSAGLGEVLVVVAVGAG